MLAGCHLPEFMLSLRVTCTFENLKKITILIFLKMHLYPRLQHLTYTFWTSQGLPAGG